MKKIITIIILTVLFNNLSAQVIFYTNCDFLGQMLLFEEGNYPFEKISKYNDIFSSVRVYNNNSGVNPYNYEVTVFENGDFTGKQLKLNGSVSCFESYNFGANDTWNDKISSFKIEKIYNRVIFDDLEKDNGQYDDEAEIFWASGCALFIRKEDFWANAPSFPKRRRPLRR